MQSHNSALGASATCVASTVKLTVIAARFLPHQFSPGHISSFPRKREPSETFSTRFPRARE